MKLFELQPLLKKHPLFREADSTLVDRYLNESTMRIDKIGSRDVVYSSNSEKLLVGTLLSGRAQVFTGLSGERALLKTLGIGELFGIANLYAEEEPFPTQIVATEESEILFIDGSAFRSLIEHDPAVLRSYLALQSRKIVYLNRKILTFTAGSAEKKLALFLLEREIDGCVTLPCSMTELSELLSIGRASLYRAMDSLLEAGYIKKQDQTILLTKKDALRSFVNQI